MWACKACASSDPTTDTVRVSFPPAKGEEELRREAEQRREEEEAEQREKEEAEGRRLALQRAEEEAARRAAEEERRAAEERRRRDEAELQQRLLREEEERRLAEQRRVEEEAARLRREEEAARQAEEERQRLAAEKAKVEAFLKKNGFSAPDGKKKSLFSSTYPIHTAVKLNDAEMVRLLIAHGADPFAKNSSGQTALQLARKSDKKGSHSNVLGTLASYGGTVGGA